MFTDANGNDCEHFLKTSSDMLAILNGKFEKLTWERSKRGLVDFIGNGARFLFGTMDEDDRKEITKKLEFEV